MGEKLCSWTWTRLRREGSGAFGARVQRVQKVQRERFLGLTGLTAGGFLSLTGPLAPRVVDCPSGNAYKVSVTGFTFSVIWHDELSAEWLTAFAPLSGCAGHPPQAGAEHSVLKVERLMSTWLRGAL